MSERDDIRDRESDAEAAGSRELVPTSVDPSPQEDASAAADEQLLPDRSRGGGAIGEVLAAPERPHAARFNAFFAILAGVGIAAVAAAALFMTGREHVDAPAWSSWAPADRGTSGAQQIADHVAPAYKAADGEQLVFVTCGKVELGNLADLPVRVAYRSNPSDTKVGLLNGDTIQYTLNGLGQNGAIRSGKPSAQRHLLLRREGLELALYSFRYLRGIDSVIVLMPPKKGDKASQALLFRKDAFEPQIDEPLGATLVPQPPTVANIDRGPDTPIVRRLTDPSLFNFTITQGPDAGPLLVLDPLRVG